MNTRIQTYTGRMLDLSEPHYSQISWVDLALGQGREPRYRGQLLRTYSVAEHEVRAAMVARAIEPKAEVPTLFHDSPEGYLGDWSTPLKMALRKKDPGLDEALSEIFSSLDLTIREFVLEESKRIGFDFDPVFSPGSGIDLAIKEADRLLLVTEARDLLPGGPRDGWTKPISTPLEVTYSAELVRVGDRAKVPERWEGGYSIYSGEIERDFGTYLGDVYQGVPLTCRETWAASLWIGHVERAFGLVYGALVPLWIDPLDPELGPVPLLLRPFFGVPVLARSWEREA